MKVLLNVTLGELANKVNRQIEVDENKSLENLCEYIIVAMNGNKMPFYELESGDITYYPYLFKENEKEKSLTFLQFKDLNLEINKQYTLEYNFENDYYFEIVIDNIYESNDEAMFKVLSGKGYGVIDDKDLFHLRKILDSKEKYLLKSEIDYLKKVFDGEECNERIANYIVNKKDSLSPKRYVFNVSLYGFEKEIKRKIVVDNDVSIDEFCRGVILAMNGDLSHSYGIKIGKNYLSDDYYDLDLLYLNLKEKQRLKIVYDWGDNWIFNVTLSKIIPDYGDLDFEVISGTGYGIIDDVGGIWGLQDIFDGKNTDWGEYDIHDFDLTKCNENIKEM